MMRKIERGPDNETAVRIVPFRRSTGDSGAARSGMDIFLQDGDISADFPPVGYPPLSSQRSAIQCAFQLVLENKWGAATRSQRLNAAQVIVLIIKSGYVDRRPV